MRSFLACSVLLAACRFTPGATTADADPPSDGGRDGSPGADAAACAGQLGGGLYTLCPRTTPEGDLSLAGTIDTDGDARCARYPQVDGPTLCVVLAANVTIDGPLRAVGSMPLVLAAADTLTVNAPIDASARLGAPPPAGADAKACAAAGAGDPGDGAGGGAGGSFGGAGGRGGNGKGSRKGGLPGAVTRPAIGIRGGCPGGSGGDGGRGQASGASSGGAVYLIAGSRIDVLAPISASGAGGRGGDKGMGPAHGGGGAGGGSGGQIGLDAPTIAVDATASLVANGGGGGEGGDNSDAGHDGEDGGGGAPDQAALGGSGGSNGGAGGDGAAGGGLDGRRGDDDDDAGGGGGGGAGEIRIFSPQPVPGTFSPTPS